MARDLAMLLNRWSGLVVSPVLKKRLGSKTSSAPSMRHGRLSSSSNGSEEHLLFPTVFHAMTPAHDVFDQLVHVPDRQVFDRL